MSVIASADIEQLVQAIQDDPTVGYPLLKIVTNAGELITFKPTKYQQRYINFVLHNRWVCHLKPRQVGSTTAMSALLFLRAAFTPHHNALIIADTKAQAVDVFQRVLRYYEHLPEMIRPGAHLTKTSIEFEHGSSLKIKWSDAKDLRSGTYNDIMVTELAFWQRPDEAWSAAMSCLSGGNTLMIAESTPNSINFFHKLYTSTKNGLKRFFVSWLDIPGNTKTSCESPITDELREYAKDNDLTQGQLNWAADYLGKICAGDFRKFLQECAVDDQSCFLMSGDPVFLCPIDWSTASHEADTGLRYFDHGGEGPYSMGVDTAGGSQTGDYSAACVVSWADPEHPKVAATLMERLDPNQYAEMCVNLAKEFNAVSVVERTGGWGVPVIEALKAAGLPQWTRAESGPRGVVKRSTSWGWDTTALTRPKLWTKPNYYLKANKLAVNCPRLQQQMAKAVFLDGRPDHPDGGHDDMIIALGLALQAKQLTIDDSYTRKPVMPSSHEEMAQAERKYGKTFNQLVDEGTFEEPSYVDEEESFPGW